MFSFTSSIHLSIHPSTHASTKSHRSNNNIPKKGKKIIIVTIAPSVTYTHTHTHTLNNKTNCSIAAKRQQFVAFSCFYTAAFFCDFHLNRPIKATKYKRGKDERFMEHTFLVMFFLKCCQISIVIVIEEQMKGGKKGPQETTWMKRKNYLITRR